MIDEMDLIAPLRPVIRKATAEDLHTLLVNREREADAFELCRRKIVEHDLDMKLVSAEYSFEGGKILFLFTADGRVDFRALVKDLAGSLHARIELRQIGVRDEAKVKGGLGICGRPFCCSEFLDEFQPVSIKMAKTQNLSLNPTKISGTCGRLMCCLKYEQEAYEDLMKSAPKLESFVETPDGAGTVTGINLLRQTVQVRLDSAPESAKTYHNTELSIVRSGKGKRPEGYVEPPLEELARLRRPPEEPPVETEWAEEEELQTGGDWEQSGATPEDGTGEPQRTGRRRRRRRSGGQKKQAAEENPPKESREPKKAGSQPKEPGDPKKADGQSRAQKGQKSEGRKGSRGDRPKGEPPKGEGNKNPSGRPPKGDAPRKEPARNEPEKAASEGEKAEGTREGSSHRRRRRRPRGGGNGEGNASTPPAEG